MCYKLAPITFHTKKNGHFGPCQLLYNCMEAPTNGSLFYSCGTNWYPASVRILSNCGRTLYLVSTVRYKSDGLDPVCAVVVLESGLLHRMGSTRNLGSTHQNFTCKFPKNNNQNFTWHLSWNFIVILFVLKEKKRMVDGSLLTQIGI